MKSLLIGLMALCSVSAFAGQAYEAEYICYLRDEVDSKILYRVAALNRNFGPSATELMIIKHNPNNGKQSVIAHADSITMEEFTSRSGGDKGIYYHGLSDGKKVQMFIFLTPYGVKANAKYDGSGLQGMDCEENTTLIVE